MRNHVPRPLLVLLLALEACRGGPDLPPEVETWLTCVECGAGELDAVLRSEDGGVVTALTDVLLQGISEDRHDAYARVAGAAWRNGGQRVDSAEYVAFRLDNITAQFRVRAAAALAALEEWETLRDALERSDSLRLRPDVVRALQELAFQPGVPLMRGGEIRGAVVDAADRAVGNVSVVLRRCEAAPATMPAPAPGECTRYVPGETQTLTSADGSFRFPDLTEGVYEVAPSLPVASGVSSDPPALLYRLVGAGDEESSTFRLVTGTPRATVIR